MNDGGDKKKAQQQQDAADESRRTRPRRLSRRLGDPGSEYKGSSTWLLSFTDVTALMLTFFVLLFAMSSPKDRNWAEVSAALQLEFNRYYGEVLHRGTQDELRINKINYDRALNIRYLGAIVEAAMAENPALANIQLISQPGALILSLPQDLLFEAGSVDIREPGSRALYALGGILSRIKNQIEVIGHADPRPVQGATEGYEDNWQLSLARASRVAALLESVGYEKSMAVRGLSSGRFEDLTAIPIDDNEKLALSRRVDIVIMDHDGRKRRRLGGP